MQICKVPRSDLSISRIGYGCAGLGTWDDSPLDAGAVSRADRLVKTACEQGINLFDHADLYAFGKSESVFGEVLKGSPGLREKIVLQSKCGQIFPKGWQPGQGIRVDLSYKHIVTAVEASLNRLNTDYLDIVLLHAPSPLVRPEEVARALDELHRSGKARHFGISNYTAAQIQVLRKAVEQPLVVNQVHLGLSNADLFTDGFEFTLQLAAGGANQQRPSEIRGSGTLDYCRINDIQIQAWSPVAPALLNPPVDATPPLRVLAQRLTALAQASRTTPAAVALAWLLHHPANIVPLTGTCNTDHLAENCAADGITLRDEDWMDLLARASDARSRVI